MAHRILEAFGAAHLAEGFDHQEHEIRVTLDGKTIGTVSPAKHHTMETAYDLGGKTIGPAFDPGQMKARLVRELFHGDAAAFGRAVLRRVRKI